MSSTKVSCRKIISFDILNTLHSYNPRGRSGDDHVFDHPHDASAERTGDSLTACGVLDKNR